MKLFVAGSGLASSNRAMVALKFALGEKRMFGKANVLRLKSVQCVDHDCRGAYCSMTMISLLGLPLDLPPNAPARAKGLTSFTSGLPEYLSRCWLSSSALFEVSD